MKYKSIDIIISTLFLLNITNDEDIIIIILELSLKTCYKYLPLIKKSLINKDNDLLYRASHEINGLSSIGLIAIVNISDDLHELSKNENIDIKLGMKYYHILEEEINKFQQWILNYIKIN